MKTADVTPIYTKGPQKIPQNYMPMSLTSIVGNILEFITADQKVDHLKTNDLLGHNSHG